MRELPVANKGRAAEVTPAIRLHDEFYSALWPNEALTAKSARARLAQRRGQFAAHYALPTVRSRPIHHGR